MHTTNRGLAWKVPPQLYKPCASWNNKQPIKTLVATATVPPSPAPHAGVQNGAPHTSQDHYSSSLSPRLCRMVRWPLISS
jgi:hypothetical protein